MQTKCPFASSNFPVTTLGPNLLRTSRIKIKFSSLPEEIKLCKDTGVILHSQPQ